jgi:hypothetical protein
VWWQNLKKKSVERPAMLDRLGVRMCTGLKWLRMGSWVKNIPGRILFRGGLCVTARAKYLERYEMP